MTGSFIDDNDDYESWLRGQCAVVESDLAYKHKRMAKDSFKFLRATYFWWARHIESLCPRLVTAPEVLGVGDLHTENFGTWRDGEGRLVWGVNDFDEAAAMPYAFDILRLGTSARLAEKISLDGKEIASAILAGYREGLLRPRPNFVYQPGSRLLPYVQPSVPESASFWAEIDQLPAAAPPDTVREVLMASLPPGTTSIKISERPKQGGGSLGRPRYVAQGLWQGGHVVREAKAWVPSAWDWAHGKTGNPAASLVLATGIHRSPDPFLALPADLKFVIRRLAPDSRKIDLKDYDAVDIHEDILSAMGADLASIHAVTPGLQAAISSDLDSRERENADWLYGEMKIAEEAVNGAFEEWKAHQG